MAIDLSLPPPSGRLGQSMRALRHRNYRLLWLGQLARGTGIWMQFVALPLLVVALGGTPFDLGLLAALQFTPILFLAPIGGVLADRVPKRILLIALQVISAVQASVLAGSVVAGVADMAVVLLLAAVFGLVNAAEMPVRWSLVSELVATEDLPNAIALHSAGFNTTRILGPAIAGLLIAFVGIWSAFVWAAAVAVVTAILVILIDPRRMLVHRTSTPGSVGTLLLEGGRFARASTAVRTSLLMLAVVSTAGMSFQAILPIIALDEFGIDSRVYGILLAAMGAGALAAAIPMSVATLEWARRLMGAAPIVLAGGLATLSVLTEPWAGAIAMAVIGLAYILSVASINLTLQHGSPADLRGRMLGFYVAILHGGTAIGGFLIGVIAELIGPVWSIRIAATVTVAATLFAARRLAALTPAAPHTARADEHRPHAVEGDT